MKTQNILSKLFCVMLVALTGQAWAGKTMPKFQLSTPQGQLVSSESLLGKGPIIINFWATWCIPCMQEMSAMKPMFEKYKAQGLQVVSISIDDSKTAPKVPAMVRQKGFPYLILLDPTKDVYRKFGISNVPELLIIDSKGNIVVHHQGYTPGDEKETEAKIRQLLGV
jgi:cytochrome c biogenesis protein CcmG/thiol:disulfide interchange protein DsbE